MGIKRSLIFREACKSVKSVQSSKIGIYKCISKGGDVNNKWRNAPGSKWMGIDDESSTRSSSEQTERVGRRVKR